MKRSLALFIAFLLMLGTVSFPLSVHANEEGNAQGNEAGYTLPTGGLQSPPEPIAVETAANAKMYRLARPYTEAQLYQELEERIKTALLSGTKDVDVSDLQIDKSKQIGRIVYYSPYLSNGIDLLCYYSTSNNQYVSIEIKNSMNADQTKAYLAAVDTEVNEILSHVSDSMSDEQKALVIHDYLVYEYEYDYDNYLTNSVPDDSFRSGGLIMKHTGVCQAYAYAFYYLMNKFDIECYFTGSETMNHAWNIIKLDDEYYHIDCTYDDPVQDRLGQVSHNYFLCSDTVIQDANHKHSGWDLTELVCDSNKYDNAYWIGVTSKINFDGATAYYLRSNSKSFGGSIVSRSNDVETAIVSNLGKWTVYGNSSSYYLGAFSGLYMKDRELYYNTPTQIRKYSLATGSDTSVAAPDTSKGYIYGSRIRSNGIQYVIKQAPDEQGARYSTGAYGAYTIKYELNGGQNADGNPTVYTSDSATIVLKNPTRSGYSFGGWYSDSGYKTKVTQIAKGSSGNKTLYAKWNSNAYTITYQLNGGKNSTANPSTYTSASDTITLKNPTRTGYSFLGWYSDSGYKTKVTQIAKGSSGNKTLYAKWSLTSYTITYQLNGGINSSTNPSKYTITSSTITLSNPTRSGYSFAGWYSDSGYKTKITQIAKGSSGNKTLYAKWNPISYKITYQLNGGKNSTANPGTYTKASSTITLKNPTRSGYSFLGWYGDSGYKTKITQIVKGSSGNKTLYAKWTPVKYKITYSLNSGKNNSANPSTYTITSSTFTLKNPTRTGYTFLGWYSDSKYTKRVTSIAKGSIGNRTLYAKWSPTIYKITYSLNSGKNNSANPSTYTITSSTITLKSPTRTGYTFLGWYSDSKYTKRVTSIAKGSIGNRTLYAKWSANSYKIRYNANGATKGKMSDTSCRYNSTCTLRSNAFQKTGYSFAGWATSKSGKVVYKNQAKVKNLVSGANGIKTLYAKWKINTYKITYQLNGGKNNSGNPSSYTIASSTITLKNPVRSGYVFKGWYTDKAYKNRITKINKGSVGNKTLYAKWVKK